MIPALLLAFALCQASAEDALPATAGAAVAAPGEGSPTTASPPQTALENLIKVKVHRESRDWEPLSLRKGGDPASLKTRFTRRIVKVQGKPKGEVCSARVLARAHSVKDDKLLIISIFPACLTPLRKHLEVRYLIIEGFLEKVQAAVVTAQARGAADDDSVLLRRRRIPYLEEFPGGGRVKLAALSLAPGEETLNAAELFDLEFADADVGLASLAYKVTGLGGKRAKHRAPVMTGVDAQKTTETASASKPSAKAAAKYNGPFGCELELPSGFEAETVSPMRRGGEAVSVHPKGSQEGAVRLEALPIDNPAVGGRADLPVYKAQIAEQLKGSQSQFTTTDISMPFPGFEMKVTMPHPQVIVVLQGKKTIYVFSSASDGPILRGLIGSLKDAP